MKMNVVELKNLTVIVLPDGKMSFQITNMNILELLIASSTLMKHIHNKLHDLEGLDLAEVIGSIAESIDAVISLASVDKGENQNGKE